MQYYNSQGDATHKGLYPGSSKPSPIYISSYSSPAREQISFVGVNMEMPHWLSAIICNAVCHLKRDLKKTDSLKNKWETQGIVSN